MRKEEKKGGFIKRDEDRAKKGERNVDLTGGVLVEY